MKFLIDLSAMVFRAEGLPDITVYEDGKIL